MAVTLKTSLGDLKLELFCDQCPRTCKNFLALAASGAYDNTIFHRNMRNFMVQGGDPTGTGKGGESIYGKAFEDEIVDTLKHDKRGMVSMASKGPNTNASQFFIIYEKQPHLNNVNTVFAQVIHGWATLDAMERAEVDAKSRPTTQIKIESIVIHANPFAEKES